MTTISLPPFAARPASRVATIVKDLPWGVILAGIVLATAIIAALAPQLLTSRDPLHADPLVTHVAPSADYWLGTDIQGRDIYTRVVYGARYSLLIGAGATAVALLLGVLLGVSAAVGPRWLDQAVVRFVDVVAAFPEVLLALLLITFTGRGTLNLVLALGIAGLPRYARLLRAQVSVAAGTGYVEQAKTFGITRNRNIFRHVLPNALGALPVIATIGLGGAIIGSSALSFLGLGPQPPAAEWGLMLSESRNYLRHAWWSGIFPGIALTTIVISATVIGRHLQTRYERRTR